MKRIKVAFCLRDMQLGGVESVLIRTLDKLQEYKNIDIYLVTYANIKEPIYKKYFETHKNIKCYSLYPCSWLSTKLPRFFLARIFIHILRDIYRGFKRIFVIPKFKDINVFIDYHDFGFCDEFKYIKGAKKIAWFHSSVNVFVKRNFIKKLNNYDKTVVLTDEFIDEFDKIYHDKKNKLIRIYNPINVAEIKNKSVQKSEKIHGDYFCVVSRLSADKDIKTLLRAFDVFWNNTNKPNIKMIFVGDGNKKTEYEKCAKALKSAKQILFVGSTRNPFVYMKNARANILSSFGEGLPTVLIEAAAVGTLNIASNCKCGPREILLNGRGGILFEPSNSWQLAQCMADVYNGKIDVQKMISESTSALKRFDSDIIIKQIISLIS